MSRCIRQRPVARHKRSAEPLCEGDVHRVVGRKVLAHPPRAWQQIEMGVTVEIEVGKIGNRFGCAAG